jgi:hypothetical protein
MFSVESPTGRLVNKVVPVPVEANDWPVIEANEKGLKRLLAEGWEQWSQQHYCSNNAVRSPA